MVLCCLSFPWPSGRKQSHEGAVTSSLLSPTISSSQLHSAESVTQPSETSTIRPNSPDPVRGDSPVSTPANPAAFPAAQDQSAVRQAFVPARNRTVMAPLALVLNTSHPGSSLPSPARSSMDMSPLHARIGDMIAEKTLHNSYGKAFVPVDVIEALRDGTRIEEELRTAPGDASAEILTRYVLEKPALNIFLTLAACNLTMHMAHFHKIGLSDDDLPLNDNDVLDKTAAAAASRRRLASGKTIQCRKLLPRDWGSRVRVDFLAKQWLFLSPVFTDRQFEHVLDRRCPIPILRVNHDLRPRTGLSGSVREIELHEAHQKVLRSPSKKVALKEISPDKYQYFDREREALAAIRGISNAHLIKPIGSYQYRGEAHGCFLFPWADGGNLRELWATEEVRPLKSLTMMRWVLTQMCGLSDALRALHSENCRHGDLKPENILLFIEDIVKTLRIADVGLARFHTVGTQQRVDLLHKTGTKTGTLRYISPEFVSEIIPRSSDTWALGCVFLEFLIWTLYGQDQLAKFNASGFEQFWVKGDRGEVTVHGKVEGWLDHMARDLAGPSGHEETALRGLLELIRSHMLVPGSDGRGEIDNIYHRLHAICQRANRDAAYALDTDLAARLSTRPPPSRSTAGSHLLPPQREEQQFAGPLRKNTIPNSDNNIRVDYDEGPSLGVPGHSASVTSRKALERQYPALRNLNDVWHSQPNNSFAKALFTRSDWLPAVSLPDESRLCQVCAAFDLSQPNFLMSEVVDSIRARAQYCQLCHIFSQVAEEVSMPTGEVFRCSRIESTLYMENGTQPILSIYADPDDTHASGNAQLGLPLLPEPGSRGQFALINEWLNICRGTHSHNYQYPKMKTQAFESISLLQSELPTRVIDVGDTQSPRLQLIDSGVMNSHEYLAFSHCWGQGPQYSALKSTVDSLRAGAVDMSLLPLSFRDAIKVTRGLHIRYLWIDSLCIIQDDEKDWEHEAARMEQVFSNAMCVIAASSAASSADGFLSSARSQREWVTLPGRTGVPRRHICRFIDDFHRDVEEAILNKRGWVLQERALARRSIHFTTTQLYMECGEGVYCESLMKLKNEKAALLGDSDFPNSILPKYYNDGKVVLFQNLFRIYSGLNFTRPSDRSRAISGLEKRLMTTFNTRGGYGIFERYLQRSLLWKRPDGIRFTPIDHPSWRAVPSWSWMTYDGSIDYLEMPFDKVDWDKEIESPFAVSTNTSTIFWEANGAGTTPILRSDKARRLIPYGCRMGPAHHVVYDLEPASEQIADFSCIIFGKRKTEAGSSLSQEGACYYVLIIEPVVQSSAGGVATAYRRVGVGSLPDGWIDWTTRVSVEVH